MASYREGRLRSIAWDHFEIKDKERGVATCNICHEAFSYRTSVSNLMKHLKNKHGYVVVKGENDDENEGGGEAENENSSEKGESKPKQTKTELWEYYQVKDEENKLATCSICLEQFSYQTSIEGLCKHLQMKHSIDMVKGSEDEENEDDDSEEKYGGGGSLQHHESRGRKMSSVAWDYFEIKDDDRKVASCNLCGALCSYKTSVSNLMKHARRKHGVAGGPDDYDDGRPEDSISQDSAHEDISYKECKLETSGRSQRSIVWLYFKPVDNESKMSQCLICKKTFSHSSTLTNLKKHLARKHPNVKIPQREDGRKRILLSSGGELFEVETEAALDGDSDGHQTENGNIMEMDTVFIEDFDLQDDEPLRKPKMATPKKRKYSSSSDEEITFINRYVRKQSDSFDHFGKYIASVLRNLPKETSSKLQADFVKQITSAEREVIPYEVAVPVTGNNQEFLSDVK